MPYLLHKTCCPDPVASAAVIPDEANLQLQLASSVSPLWLCVFVNTGSGYSLLRDDTEHYLNHWLTYLTLNQWLIYWLTHHQFNPTGTYLRRTGIKTQIFSWKNPVVCAKMYAILLCCVNSMTHIYFSKLTIIGSDDGLSPGRRQAIIWTNAGIWLIRTLGTKVSEILREFHTFSFKKMHLKVSSAKWRLFRLGLNVCATSGCARSPVGTVLTSKYINHSFVPSLCYAHDDKDLQICRHHLHRLDTTPLFF